MENWNKIESVPAVDALVKESPVVEPTVVEQKAPAPAAPKPAQVAHNSSDSVVLYAIKDIATESGASVLKGYSRVSNKDAELLLQYGSIRKASAEEIETYFNK